MIKNYIESIDQSFQYYELLGEKTMEQLSDEELFYSSAENDNSIAVIVKHLSGNMLSRWTNFLTEDGEKKWRKRDEEFESDMKSRAEVLKRWHEGWACLFTAIDSINDKNFTNLVYIRNQGHTIIEACNRQLAHYAYHVGQMVYLGKSIKGNKWKSLSIPKGDSKKFNAEKFDQEKHKENFVDEYLNPHAKKDMENGEVDKKDMPET